LRKLNQFNGDFIAAEMVKAFISSNGISATFWALIATYVVGLKLRKRRL
jgi:hypothetical protein